MINIEVKLQQLSELEVKISMVTSSLAHLRIRLQMGELTLFTSSRISIVLLGGANFSPDIKAF